jgi:hypothetical protein
MAYIFHNKMAYTLTVRTRKGIPVITFKIQERHAMMYIDNEVLEKMIMTIVEGFDRIEKKLDRMGRVKEFLNGDELLDNYDIARLLNVSLRTVARYREKGLIRYYQTDENGKNFYRSSDIQDFLQKRGKKN